MPCMHLLSIIVLLLLSGCAGIHITNEPVLRLHQVHPFGATALAYNDNGSLLATGGFYGEVRVWRMPDGVQLKKLPGRHETVRGLVWADDGTLIVATEDGGLVVWDVRMQRVLQRVVTAPLKAAVFIPGSQHLITAHRDGALRAFAYPTLELLKERNLGAAVRALAITRDGTQLAAATGARQVLLLDAQLHVIKTLAPPPRTVQSLRFAPDGRQLIAGTWYKLLLWDLNTGHLSVRDTEHFGAIISLDYTPDGHELVSLGRNTDSKLRITDVASGQVRSRLASLPLCGWMLQVSPDGRFVAAGSEDGSVLIYSVASSE